MNGAGLLFFTPFDDGACMNIPKICTYKQSKINKLMIAHIAVLLNIGVVEANQLFSSLPK